MGCGSRPMGGADFCAAMMPYIAHTARSQDTLPQAGRRRCAFTGAGRRAARPPPFRYNNTGARADDKAKDAALVICPTLTATCQVDWPGYRFAADWRHAQRACFSPADTPKKESYFADVAMGRHDAGLLDAGRCHGPRASRLYFGRAAALLLAIARWCAIGFKRFIFSLVCRLSRSPPPPRFMPHWRRCFMSIGFDTPQATAAFRASCAYLAAHFLDGRAFIFPLPPIIGDFAPPLPRPRFEAAT